MLHLQLNILMLLFPAACGLYWLYLCETSSNCRVAAGVAYCVLLFVFLERFILMLHFASHKAIFKNRVLQDAMTYFLPPFFGIPPGKVYYLHHVIMHHIENNRGLDISATEGYQRDSWLNFLMYWLRFALLIAIEVPYYGLRTKRYKYCAEVVAFIVLWMVTIGFLATFVSFGATMWVLVVPHALTMSAMAFGNWSQHIFVDPDRPASNYTLTYNCIDTPNNQTTFNDGYHVVHHQNARLHWSEMPGYFHENQKKHHDGGALTFRGVHFMDVGILTMTKQLHKLAKHYVHLGPEDEAPTLEEVTEILKLRLRPVPKDAAPLVQKA